MKSTSIAAYERPARVASYDADMAVMHPNRHKMVDIALEVLPFDPATTITALDLGTGTGFFTAKFLERYPQASVISVDGSNSMVDLARTRLGALVERVDFRIGDFRHLQSIIPESAHGEVVFSSYALHHLNHAEKREVISQALRFLKPGGWLINADIVSNESQVIEERVQQIRVEGMSVVGMPSIRASEMPHPLVSFSISSKRPTVISLSPLPKISRSSGKLDSFRVPCCGRNIVKLLSADESRLTRTPP